MISSERLRHINRLVRSLVIIFLGTAVAQAGEIKGKVTASGLTSARNIAVYIDTIPGARVVRVLERWRELRGLTAAAFFLPLVDVPRGIMLDSLRRIA